MSHLNINRAEQLSRKCSDVHSLSVNVHFSFNIFHFHIAGDDLEIIQRYINHGDISYFLLFYLDTKSMVAYMALFMTQIINHKAIFPRFFLIRTHAREKMFWGKESFAKPNLRLFDQPSRGFSSFSILVNFFCWFWETSKLIRKCQILLLKYLSLKAC